MRGRLVTSLHKSYTQNKLKTQKQAKKSEKQQKKRSQKNHVKNPHFSKTSLNKTP